MESRELDVVLYGASGFVGRQTVAYFARHAPDTLRWAVAGRDASRLREVLSEEGCESTPVLAAEGGDARALEALAARTRVVLSTAGPFMRYGSALVAACVERRTHYVDITGETPWVRDLIDRHHAQAAADGTRIVPCCGFDSVPADLGVWLVVQHLREQRGIECGPLVSCYRVSGGLNGGTMATVFLLHETGQMRRVADPFLLNEGPAPDEQVRAASLDPRSATYHPLFQAWTAPFFMGPINTRVVRRSASLAASWGEGYGKRFAYREYLSLGRPGRSATARALAITEESLQWMMDMRLTRALLRWIVPKPGKGPSRQVMDRGWYRCDLAGTLPSGEVVRCRVADSGDPGNRATTRLVCESALAIALQEESLPGGPTRGGVLTPATALGQVLVERLRAAGVTLEVAVHAAANPA
jgi:short subunit dehydrogenase-like uncharacterized protein